MPKSAGKRPFTRTERDLVRRYLIWCFKTTKEELDRIDRKFTQLKVDEHVLALLLKYQDTDDLLYVKKIEEFRNYIAEKAASANIAKYKNGQTGALQSDYLYLQNRLTVLEKTIEDFLGVKELQSIRGLYEDEMVQRILTAREHS